MNIIEDHLKIQTSEGIHAVYSSDLIGDMALVIPFILDCPNIGGVQPVFLAQKHLSLSVREQENIPSPYVN